MSDDPELRILQSIHAQESAAAQLRQRDIADASGASLGMTNTILKRLAQKGLITIQRLNARNIQYVVTPNGINEIVKRSYRYLRQTVRSIGIWRDIIDQTVTRAKQDGYTSMLLCGNSELGFLVEYSCARHGINYRQLAYREGQEVKADAKCLVLWAETVIPPAATDNKTEKDRQTVYLHHVLYRM